MKTQLTIQVTDLGIHEISKLGNIWISAAFTVPILLLAIVLMYYLINIPYTYLIDQQDPDDMTPRDFVFLFVELREPILKALGLWEDLKPQPKNQKKVAGASGKASKKKKD